MQQLSYNFLDLTPASLRYLYIKICEFDIAASVFAGLINQDICSVRRTLLVEAKLATDRMSDLAIALAFAAQGEFNYCDACKETQRFVYHRLQCAETAKDWVLTFRNQWIRDIQAIEDEAKGYAATAPDEEIAEFFRGKTFTPSSLSGLAREAAIE